MSNPSANFVGGVKVGRVSASPVTGESKEDLKALFEAKLKEVVFVELSEEDVCRAMCECAELGEGAKVVVAQIGLETWLEVVDKIDQFQKFMESVPRAFWSMLGRAEVKQESFTDFLRKLDGKHLSFAVGLFNVSQMLYTGDYSLKSISIAVVQTLAVFAPSLGACYASLKAFAAGGRALVHAMRPKEVVANGVFDVDWAKFFSALLGVEVKNTPVDVAAKLGRTWRDVVSFGALVSFLFTGVYVVVKAVVQKAGYGYLLPSITQELDDLVEKYVESCIDVLEKRPEVSAWGEQAEYSELVSLINRGTEIVRMANSARTVVPLVNAMLAKLLALRTAVLTFRAGSSMRVEPVCVALYGKAGTYKTSFVSYFGRVVAGDRAGNQVYERPQEAKYWDGYAGQDVMLYDDKLTIVENTRMNEFHAEFLSVVGTAPLPLNMAALEDKNGTMFTSKYVFLTTNLSLVNGLPKSAQANLVDAEAINRRMHIVVEVVSKGVFKVVKLVDFGFEDEDSEILTAVGREMNEVALAVLIARYRLLKSEHQAKVNEKYVQSVARAKKEIDEISKPKLEAFAERMNEAARARTVLAQMDPEPEEVKETPKRVIVDEVEDAGPADPVALVPDYSEATKIKQAVEKSLDDAREKARAYQEKVLEERSRVEAMLADYNPARLGDHVVTFLAEHGVVANPSDNVVLGSVKEGEGSVRRFVMVVRDKWIAQKKRVVGTMEWCSLKIGAVGAVVRDKFYGVPDWVKSLVKVAAIGAAVLAGAALVFTALYGGVRLDMLVRERDNAGGDDVLDVLGERPGALFEGLGSSRIQDEFDHELMTAWYVKKGVEESLARKIVADSTVAPSRPFVQAQHYQKGAHLNPRLVPRVDVAGRTKIAPVARVSPIAAQMGATSDGLAARFRQAILKVSVAGNFTNGFVLAESQGRLIVVCALHVFSPCLSKKEDGNVRFTETEVVLTHEKAGTMTFNTADYYVKFLDCADLVMFEAPKFDGYQFKNLMGYLRKRSASSKSSSTWFRVSKKESAVVGGLAKIKSVVEYDELKSMLRFVVKDAAEVGISGKPGDCGLPYFDSSIGKIVGFHVAGSEHVSVCSQFYLDDVADVVAQCDYEDLPYPNVPTRSSILPNPLGEEIDGLIVSSRDGPQTVCCKQFPVLTNKEAWVNVKEKIVERLKRDPVDFPVEWLLMTNDYLKTFYKFEDRELSLKEAILGVPGLIDAMDLDTGVGYPWNLENPKTKYWIDGVSIDADLYDRICYVWKVISDPRFDPLDEVEVDVIFPKDECLKAGKVPRPVHLLSKALCVIERMLWGCAYACVKENCVNAPIAVGINPHGEDWGNLKKRFPKKVVCADLSEQDVSIARNQVQYFCLAFEQESTSNLQTLRRQNLAKLIMRMPTFVDGVWLRRLGGNTTGSFVTSLLASYDTVCVYVGFHMSCNPFHELQDLIDSLGMTVYGDDSIAADEDVDFSKMTAVMAEYGKKVTNASKTGPPELVEWKDVEYLSRSFVEEGGVCYAPLRYSIIFDMLYFMRSKNSVVAVSLVRSAMYESVHHGKAFYDSMARILNEGLKRSWGIEFLFVSFEDMLVAYREGLVFSIEDDPIYAQSSAQYEKAHALMWGRLPRRGREPLEAWPPSVQKHGRIVAQMDATPVEGDDPGLPPIADVPVGELETLRIATVDGQRSYKFWNGISHATGVPFKSLDNAQLVKPYLIAAIDWATTDIQGKILQVFHFPYDLLAIPAVAARLQHVVLMRADVEVELVLNSNKFVTGALLVTCLPCYQPQVPDRDRWSSLTAASTSPSVIMSANTTGSVKIEMPYASPWPFVSTTYPTGPAGSIAAMQIAVLAPLDLVQASGTPRVTVQVFASFKNAVFTNPTPLTLVIPSATTFSPAGYGGLVVEGKNKKYVVKAGEKVLIEVQHPDPRMWHKRVVAELAKYKLKPQGRRKKAGRVVGHITEERLQKSEGFMGVVDSIPVVGPVLRNVIDGPLSTAFSGLLAGLAFMDKPAMLPDVRHFIVGEQIDQCTGDGVSVARKLTASNAQFLPNDNKYVSETSDAMSVANLVVRPSFLQNFGVAGSQTEGALLFQAPVWLTIPPTGTAPMTILQWLGTFFRFWRGTMRFSFKFHASQFSTCRVRFAWFPLAYGTGGPPNPIDLSLLSEGYSQDVEVKGDTTVVIDIPPSVLLSWLAVRTQTSGMQSINGYMAVYLSSRLNSFDIATGGVSCSVFVSGLPDFEFAAPNNLQAADTYFDINPQASVQELGVMNLNPIAPAEYGLDQTNTFGEAVPSLALVARRFHFLETVSVNPANGYSYQLYDRLIDSNPVSSLGCMLWRMLYPFHMSRGGFRFKIVRETTNRGSMIIYNTSQLRGVTIELARYLSSGGAYNLGPEVQEFTVEVAAYAPQLWYDLFVNPVTDDPMGQNMWPGVGIAVSVAETIAVYVAVADDFVAGNFAGVPCYLEVP